MSRRWRSCPSRSGAARAWVSSGATARAKSTLLQIIAGTLRPSTGRVEGYGRVAALLELGSGFNPEYTGRENIYLNASILGLSREQTRAKFDGSAAFADIGQFLDQPVKTYSSGMVLRLAFAVAINVEPEILIIDEALAVGDVFFTQKCFQRLRDILDAGTTLLFVSHSMAAVQNLCGRALLLNAGRKVFEGPPEEAASRYYALAAGRAAEAADTPAGAARPDMPEADRSASEGEPAPSCARTSCRRRVRGTARGGWNCWRPASTAGRASTACRSG